MRWVFALLLVLTLLTACGKSDDTAGDDVPRESRRAFIQAQLTELAALPVPAGADAQTWAQLKSSLAAMLRAELEHSESAQSSGGWTLARSGSATTTSDASQAPAEFDEGTAVLSWGFYSAGDYDQNGEVNISDLTPLGVNFNSSVTGAPNSVLAVIDGDSNGILTIADLTPIGRNFGARVTGYNVYTSLSATDAPTEPTDPSTLEPLNSVPFSAATGSPTAGRRQFSYTVDSPVPLAYYWVRPTDGVDEGTRSTLAGGPPNDAPDARLTVCPYNGSAPFTATLDGEASRDPDGDIAIYRYDFDGNGTFDSIGGEPVVEHEFVEPGIYPVILEVVDQLGKTDRAIVQVYVDEPAPWGQHVLNMGGLMLSGGGPQIISADGHPAVALLGSGNQVNYSRALDSQGLQWPDTPAAVPGAPSGGFSLLRMLVVDGRPTVIVNDSFDDAYKLIRASDAEGSAWDAPVAAPFDAYGPGSDFQLVDGTLCAVLDVTDFTNPATLQFARAADAAGTTWGAAVDVVAPTAGQIQQSELLDIGGLPTIVYGVEVNFEPAGVFIVQATAVDGSAWGAPVQLPLPPGFTRFSGADVADGRPCVLVQHSDFNHPSPLRFMRASSADGSSWDSVVSIPYASVFSSLAVVNELPAITWHLSGGVENNGMQYFQSALNREGTLWGEPVVVGCETRGISANLADLGELDVIAWHRSDGGVIGGGSGVSVRFSP